MLPPFQIRNLQLRSPIQPTSDTPKPFVTQDSLVQISASGYDQTISDNPSAALTYRDEERDIITIGSSTELMQKLVEPAPLQSRKAERLGQHPMAIATLLAGEQKPHKDRHHMFDIDDSQDVKSVWRSIQADHNSEPAAVPERMASGKIRNEEDMTKPVDLPGEFTQTWTSEEDSHLLLLRENGFGWQEVSEKLPGRSPVACELHWKNDVWDESMWTDEKKNRLAKVYEQ